MPPVRYRSRVDFSSIIIRLHRVHNIRSAYAAADLLWSVCRFVCALVSVCLLGTTVSPAKTAEPIEMPFGMWTRWEPRRRRRGLSLQLLQQLVIAPSSSFGGRSVLIRVCPSVNMITQTIDCIYIFVKFGGLG